tara:strand:+ start:116 stop:457 length:342 start_codon:yes stop_codon:yes gene_type:complete
MVMIAQKKQTRFKPLTPTAKKRLQERGDSIGRKVKGKTPTRLKDRMGPRTSKSPKKTIGSLMSEGMSKVMATNAMKKAARELAKRVKPSGRSKRKFGPITPKRGKPGFMKKGK